MIAINRIPPLSRSTPNLAHFLHRCHPVSFQPNDGSPNRLPPQPESYSKSPLCRCITYLPFQPFCEGSHSFGGISINERRNSRSSTDKATIHILKFEGEWELNDKDVNCGGLIKWWKIINTNTDPTTSFCQLHSINHQLKVTSNMSWSSIVV